MLKKYPLGEMLKLYGNKHGLSRPELLAEFLGIRTSKLKQYLDGRTPHPSHLTKMCQLMGIQPSRIITTRSVRHLSDDQIFDLDLLAAKHQCALNGSGATNPTNCVYQAALAAYVQICNLHIVAHLTFIGTGTGRIAFFKPHECALIIECEAGHLVLSIETSPGSIPHLWTQPLSDQSLNEACVKLGVIAPAPSGIHK